MDWLLIFRIALTRVVVLVGCWLGWQLLRQNRRMLLRLDELEKRLDELEFAEPGSSRREKAHSEIRNPKSGIGNVESLVTSAATSRFSNRSLTQSRINRRELCEFQRMLYRTDANSC